MINLDTKRRSGYIVRFLVTILTAVVIAGFVAAGFSLGLPKYNLPAQYLIRLQGIGRSEFRIRVLGYRTVDVPVPQDGRVLLQIPRLPRACSLQWYGIKLIDRSPRNAKKIEIICGKKIVVKLSIKDIESLPLDPSGTRTLDLSQAHR
jgi:hypothetical protein